MTKTTYLLEYHPGGLVSTPSVHVLDATTGRIYYRLERDAWSPHWSFYDHRCLDSITGVGVAPIQVATARKDDGWFSGLSYRIETGTPRGRVDFARRINGFVGRPGYHLTPCDSQDWHCSFTNTTSCCAPTEFTIALQVSGTHSNSVCTLADVTSCCGCFTFAVTLDNNNDDRLISQYQMTTILLVGCALVQHDVLQQRSSSAAAGAAG